MAWEGIPTPGIRQYNGGVPFPTLNSTDALVVDRIGVGTGFVEGSALASGSGIPAFMVCRSANISPVPTSTNYLVPFDTLSGNSGQSDSNDPLGFNPQSAFKFAFNDPNGGVKPAFVAPVAGIYQFHCQLYFHCIGDATAATHRAPLSLFLIINDAAGAYVSELDSYTQAYIDTVAGHSNQWSISLSGASPMPAGGYAYIVLGYDAIAGSEPLTNISLNAYQTFFMGFRVQ